MCGTSQSRKSDGVLLTRVCVHAACVCVIVRVTEVSEGDRNVRGQQLKKYQRATVECACFKAVRWTLAFRNSKL